MEWVAVVATLGSRGFSRRSPIGRGTAFRSPSVRVRVSPSAHDARGHLASDDVRWIRESSFRRREWNPCGDGVATTTMPPPTSSSAPIPRIGDTPEPVRGSCPAGTVTGTVVVVVAVVGGCDGDFGVERDALLFGPSSVATQAHSTGIPWALTGA